MGGGGRRDGGGGGGGMEGSDREKKGGRRNMFHMTSKSKKGKIDGNVQLSRLFDPP